LTWRYFHRGAAPTTLTYGDVTGDVSNDWSAVTQSRDGHDDISNDNELPYIVAVVAGCDNDDSDDDVTPAPRLPRDIIVNRRHQPRG